MSAFAADEVTGAGTFDFARTEGGGTDDTLRNLRAALVLGWRVESNWTDPLLFFIYTVARPIASLLLLVVMVTIIGGSAMGTKMIPVSRRRIRRLRPLPNCAPRTRWCH